MSKVLFNTIAIQFLLYYINKNIIVLNIFYFIKLYIFDLKWKLNYNGQQTELTLKLKEKEVEIKECLSVLPIYV